MAAGKRKEPRSAGEATAPGAAASGEGEAGLRAEAAGRIGGAITVLEERDGRVVAIRRALRAGDVIATARLADHLIAVTSDGRRHELGPTR